MHLEDMTSTQNVVDGIARVSRRESGRRFMVAGNWKMQPSTLRKVDEIIGWLNAAELDSGVEVVICPTALHLLYVQSKLKDPLSIGAQNAFHEGVTGEITFDQLQDEGVRWVILGHSERRHILGESNEMVAEKVAHAVGVPSPTSWADGSKRSGGAGAEGRIKVILCVGETEEERDGGRTVRVIEKQLEAVVRFGVTSVELWRNIVVAYEPVWAIGTGKVATTEIAERVHRGIRQWLSDNIDKGWAKTEARILYGGSVKAKNCVDLGDQDDIDGLLVGSASLESQFVEIINSRRERECGSFTTTL